MIFDILDGLQIRYRSLFHPPVTDSVSGEKYYKGFTGGKIKNLFLQNHKKNRFYLVLLESCKLADLKAIGRVVHEKRLSFAAPEQLAEYLGGEPGVVTPFGLKHDKQKKVVVCIDSEILNYSELAFHGDESTSGLIIGAQDFMRYLDWTGNEYHVFACK